MWGCIVTPYQFAAIAAVPSLYVRVYRENSGRIYAGVRSLIICEGVSSLQIARRVWGGFPHYMWGCIMRQMTRMHNRRVPSLYVRVYHRLNNCRKKETGSLIICEGVSGRLISKMQCTPFPHYMWWCIVNHNTSQSKPEVPSLYVRVYRCGNFSPHASGCSLTIREGVSLAPTVKDEDGEFPHCMWGCIEQWPNFNRRVSVPSLYVRVYRKNRVSYHDPDSSLIMCECM